MLKAKVIRIAGVESADPSQEREFNEWYNKIHVPEVCDRIPGVIRGTRYEIVGPEQGYPKYLTVYELEDWAVNSVDDYLAKQRRGDIPSFTPGPPLKRVWTKTYKRMV